MKSFVLNSYARSGGFLRASRVDKNGSIHLELHFNTPPTEAINVIINAELAD